MQQKLGFSVTSEHTMTPPLHGENYLTIRKAVYTNGSQAPRETNG